MAWIEQVDKRGRGTKVFQSDTDALRGAVDSQVATAWHYGSDFSQDVNMTPQHITAGGHDGWRVTNNGWHYFLGQPNGLADGFVGFGGRQGDKWLLFRLTRVGYMHWPTRAWDDIGGAPDYDRANLSQETRTTEVVTSGENIPVEAVANWTDIWNTPGGGALDISWRADGNRLKEDITINQAARTWIGANRPPSTPASETYFGFVFRLGSAPDVNNIVMDLAYLPRWLKNSVLQTETDFDDDDGTTGIEVQNALQEFLFFLPIDEAYVDEVDGEGEITRTSIKLRKRIYRDGGNWYLLVGAKVSDLAGLPAGDLVFDPTVDYQVGASGDDSSEAATVCSPDAGTFNADATDEYIGMRWQSVTIANGATVDTATVDFYMPSYNWDEPMHPFGFEDGLNPAAFTTDASDISNRGLTTASITYGNGNNINCSGDWTVNSSIGAPIVKSIIEELVASYDYSGGAEMVCVIQGTATAQDDCGITFYDDTAGLGAKLHIEYTGNGEPEILPYYATRHLMTLRGN